MRARSHVIVLCVAAFACSLVPTSAGARPTSSRPPVITGSADQDFPFANDTYLAWTQNRVGAPRNYDAYIQLLTGGTRTRINARGDGYPGNFEPGSDTLIYQQTVRRRSDLFLYDAGTGMRTKLPEPVNTRNWEMLGRISDNYILFARVTRRDVRVFLHDRDLATNTRLVGVDPSRVFLFVNDVGEEYASWTTCTRRTCRSWIHTIATDETRRIPTVDGRPQYAVTIDESTGSAYWIRSGFGCGKNVRALRAPLTDLTDTTMVYDFPRGTDTGWTSSLAPNGGGGVNMWVSYYDCSRGRGDVWVLEDVGPPP